MIYAKSKATATVLVASIHSRCFSLRGLSFSVDRPDNSPKAAQTATPPWSFFTRLHSSKSSELLCAGVYLPVPIHGRQLWCAVRYLARCRVEQCDCEAGSAIDRVWTSALPTMLPSPSLEQQRHAVIWQTAPIPLTLYTSQ